MLRNTGILKTEISFFYKKHSLEFLPCESAKERLHFSGKKNRALMFLVLSELCEELSYKDVTRPLFPRMWIK